MDFLLNGPVDAPARLLLAHGAGTPMDHPALERIAMHIAARDIQVARFEFPYMSAQRTSGRRQRPDREAVLVQTWLNAITAQGGPSRVVIGGRSMGGRIASMIAAESGVRGLVCLAYPFHPVGHPDRVRVAHLEHLRVPTLIVQGERDPFGTPAEIAAYPLPNSIHIEWLADADHSFRPRQTSGYTAKQHFEQAAALTADFVLARFAA